MTYRELYENALHLVCEGMADVVCVEDYEVRSCYILPTFCVACARADEKYRMTHADPSVGFSACAYVDLDDDFPLCEVFMSSAIYYLAAMLVIDENEEMSDRFFSLYSDSLSTVLDGLPATASVIKDCYGLL